MCLQGHHKSIAKCAQHHFLACQPFLLHLVKKLTGKSTNNNTLDFYIPNALSSDSFRPWYPVGLFAFCFGDSSAGGVTRRRRDKSWSVSCRFDGDLRAWRSSCCNERSDGFDCSRAAVLFPVACFFSVGEWMLLDFVRLTSPSWRASSASTLEATLPLATP